jgi:hypothetical protein
MSHMDKRLLETLRDVRAGKLTFNQPGGNDPKVITRLTTLCNELGLDPKLGMLPSMCADQNVIILQSSTYSPPLNFSLRRP